MFPIGIAVAVCGVARNETPAALTHTARLRGRIFYCWTMPQKRPEDQGAMPVVRLTHFGFQYRPSKQEIATSEIGATTNVRCRNSEPRMAEKGQIRKVSKRAYRDRSAFNSRHQSSQNDLKRSDGLGSTSGLAPSICLGIIRAAACFRSSLLGCRRALAVLYYSSTSWVGWDTFLRARNCFR
jgi:hypothetical protein